jgi:hypothetical protein
MPQGKPTDSFSFSQDEAPGTPEEVPEIDPDAVVETGEKELSARKETKLRNELLRNNTWSETPHYEDQADRFPSTVKTVSVKYHLFNVISPIDMEKYSDILLSHERKGRYLFDSPEVVQWDLPNGRCFILVRVAERRFLTLSTTNTDPNET